MNSELIYTLLAKVSEIPGNSVTYLSPQSFNVAMSQNNQSITLSFFIPTKFPEVPPLCSVVDSTNITDAVSSEIELRISEICIFVRNQKNIFLLITQEVRSILWKESDSNVEDVRFPDSIETSRLIVETTLNQKISDEWIRKRAKNFLDHPSFEQDKRTRYYLLIYCFFRACKGDYSLEECADLLIKEFRVIDPPCPPLQSIPDVISKLPDYFQELFKTTGSDEISQTMSFFNDFNVISLCAPSVVRARNRVDRRIYAIKVIHLNQKTSTLPPGIGKITHLQHRYVVRYYNYWISDCDENESRAISDAFCLSPPIKEQANFLFVQMDYLTGRPLSEMLHDPHFFECSGLQWRVTQQVLEALCYLHSQDFVHNSMTPTNIIIDGENAKIGDFSDRTKQIPFPYWDSRTVRDKKSDMFAFGVVFFEMWHPFTSEDERLKILTALVKKGEVPDQWKSVFPLQAKIVSLLMQPENNRPMAKELLPLIPAKIVEKEELHDLDQLTSAISTGNIQLKLHAPEVLESLFMESRRLPFKLTDFNNPRLSHLKKNFMNLNLMYNMSIINNSQSKNESQSNSIIGSNNIIGSITSNSQSLSSSLSPSPLSSEDDSLMTMMNICEQIRSFETFIILTFFKTAQSFGALYYQSSIVTQLTNDNNAVVVMSNDGVLHELQSSCTSSFKRMIQNYQVRNSFKSCTRLSRLRESKRSLDHVYEDDVLCFNTTNKHKSIYNYFEHIQFIIQYGLEAFISNPHTGYKPVIKICHAGLTNWLINHYRNKNKPFKNHKNIDADVFMKMVKQTIDKKVDSNINVEEIQNYINDLNQIVLFIKSTGSCHSQNFDWPIVMTFSVETDPAFLIMLSISNTVVAYTQTVINKSANSASAVPSSSTLNNPSENEREAYKIPIITSTRVLLMNALSVLKINSKETIYDKNENLLMKSYKPNSKEVFIIIVCQPFSSTQTFYDINREVYPGKEWNRSFVQMCPVAKLLRENGVAVSFASNDGKAVEYHYVNATLSFTPVVIVAYVDERNKITLRFSTFSNMTKMLENLILSGRDFKRRITIQYNANLKNGKH